MPPITHLKAVEPEPKQAPSGSLFGGPKLPSPTCQALCCKRGIDWIDYHLTLDEYFTGPSKEFLDKLGWVPASGSVRTHAREVQALGLAPWHDLPPMVREKFTEWSPVARQLWESDFVEHREALVRAWIWHYLNDNLFSFSCDEPAATLVRLSSPVWEHVRALRGDLDVLRTRADDLVRDRTYRIQIQAWIKMTEHLVRDGLGLKHYTTAAELIPHYKASIRLLLADGAKSKIPDRAHDTFDCNDGIDIGIKQLLESALHLQDFLHGMRGLGTYTLRFTPVGSTKRWGFAFDRAWMELDDVLEIPDERPGEALPDVQLVSDPMLVVSGADGHSYEREFTLWARMRVVAPWTFGGEEAEKHAFPGFEKGWRERRGKESNEKKEAGKRAEEAKGTKKTKRTKRTKRVTAAQGTKRSARVKGNK